MFKQLPHEKFIKDLIGPSSYLLTRELNSLSREITGDCFWRYMIDETMDASPDPHSAKFYMYQCHQYHWCRYISWTSIKQEETAIILVCRHASSSQQIQADTFTEHLNHTYLSHLFLHIQLSIWCNLMTFKTRGQGFLLCKCKEAAKNTRMWTQKTRASLPF